MFQKKAGGILVRWWEPITGSWDEGVASIANVSARLNESQVMLVEHSIVTIKTSIDREKLER